MSTCPTQACLKGEGGLLSALSEHSANPGPILSSRTSAALAIPMGIPPLLMPLPTRPQEQMLDEGDAVAVGARAAGAVAEAMAEHGCAGRGGQ